MEETIKLKDISKFSLDIENGSFLWKVILKDNTISQIYYRYVKHKTKSGNVSKIKIYYIRRNNKILVFDEELKRMFKAFRRPFLMSGI